MKAVSRRARRIGRHQTLRKAPGINLVSLMDIFTILVFFLLVNSSSEQELPSAKALTLPTTVSQTPPGETLRVIITPDDLLVQGRRVMTMEELINSTDEVLLPLKEELAYRQSLSGSADEDTLTVIADQSISYDIIKRVIHTGRELHYSRIAFAANQVGEQGEAISAGMNEQP